LAALLSPGAEPDLLRSGTTGRATRLGRRHRDGAEATTHRRPRQRRRVAPPPTSIPYSPPIVSFSSVISLCLTPDGLGFFSCSCCLGGRSTASSRASALLGRINVGLVGCVLSPTGTCANVLNQLTAVFNDALKSMLAVGIAANNKLPLGLRYSLADSYALACCGAGRLNAEDLLLGLVCASNWSIDNIFYSGMVF
jgi:hypothetical protein